MMSELRGGLRCEWSDGERAGGGEETAGGAGREATRRTANERKLPHFAAYAANRDAWACVGVL